MGILPEVFEVRDDDFLYVLNEHPPEEYRERLDAGGGGRARSRRSRSSRTEPAGGCGR